MSSKFLAIYLLLAFLSHGTCSYMATTASGWDDHDFFRHCPPSRCSKDGPEIRFPHRLESSNTSSACRASCARLACSGQDTILHHPILGPCKVTSIDYKEAVINIIHLLPFPCPLQKLMVDSLPPLQFRTNLTISRMLPKISSAQYPALAAQDSTSHIWCMLSYTCICFHWIAGSSPEAPFQFLAQTPAVAQRSRKKQKNSSTLLRRLSVGGPFKMEFSTTAWRVNVKSNSVHSAHEGIKHSAQATAIIMVLTILTAQT
jgi:hypothetical protein